MLTIRSYLLNSPPSWNWDQLWSAGQPHQHESQSFSEHSVDFIPWEEDWSVPQSGEEETETLWFKIWTQRTLDGTANPGQHQGPEEALGKALQNVGPFWNWKFVNLRISYSLLF